MRKVWGPSFFLPIARWGINWHGRPAFEILNGSLWWKWFTKRYKAFKVVTSVHVSSDDRLLDSDFWIDRFYGCGFCSRRLRLGPAL